MERLLEEGDGGGGHGEDAGVEGGVGEGFEVAGVGAGEGFAGFGGCVEFGGVHGTEPEEGYGDFAVESEDAYVFAAHDALLLEDVAVAEGLFESGGELGHEGGVVEHDGGGFVVEDFDGGGLFWGEIVGGG